MVWGVNSEPLNTIANLCASESLGKEKYRDDEGRI
ncbi:hypothetical protein CfE428DRAFT_3973 [Chthoniobacter flavus Ellin428]|uniref:Uncharacterized protein n=1 Tax=Chthoniobacter flavus Ellin428 TaxID=497964 RepID=B4D4Y5_9BACT|nr:hypothetical protein CfE428DRAFT_3973 [Chthoniobacter flavus Ellin428]TCO90957.1 hypothetical protein EV701_109107 [Chthoniobacter flavus]